MDIAALGVTLVATLALLVLGKRNIFGSDVFQPRKPAQPIPVKVRTDQPRKRRSPHR